MYAAHTLPQDSPIPVCGSNPFIFINFHTLGTQWRFATLSLQPLPHSLPCNGGGSPFSASCPPSANSYSPLFLSLLFATHPRNPQLTPFFATLPKTPSRKSFACHTCDTPHPRLLSRSVHSSLVASRTHLLAFFAPARLTLQVGNESGRSGLGTRDPGKLL